MPVTITSSAFEADVPVFIELCAGPNLWSWKAYQSGTVISEQAFEYGGFTLQFNELAALWSTYRLDAVKVEFYPNNTGAGA